MKDRKVFLIQVVIVTLLAVYAPLAPAASNSEDVSCAVKPTVRGIEKTAEKNVEILADKIDFPERGVVHLRGYTQLIRGGYRVYADELIYNKITNHVIAKGVVKFETPEGDIIRTSVLNYDIQTGRIESGPADFLLADRKDTVLGDGHGTVNAYGTADSITVKDKNILDLTGAKVTSCLDGRKDMTFTADNLSVNMDEGVRRANRAKVRISAPERHEKFNETIKSLE